MLLTLQPIWIDFVPNSTNLNDLFESMRFESCPPQDLETDLPGWTWDIVVFSSCHNCLYVNNNSQSFELIQKIRENVGKLQVGDTECNSTIGPLHAVDMVYKNRFPFCVNKIWYRFPGLFLFSYFRYVKYFNYDSFLVSRPDVFFGPLCSYVLAPVSRWLGLKISKKSKEICVFNL